MSRICVCGIDAMPDVVERMRPHGLISLLPPADQPPTPLGIRKGGHLRILIDDIDEPQIGYTAPAREHVAKLVAFLRAAPPRVSLVIHCLAGVSRSPAAALVALALDAPGREVEAARVLREASPFASPNRLLVSLADHLLQRKGALVAALDAMGDPDWSRDFEAFLLPRQLPPA
jgi:predicted protein tyrosine phosphatase